MNKNLEKRIRELLDLKMDTEFADTDFAIRKNVDFKSANSWTLIFAIFIASVGLNTNSAAVIIGAMLISPLMGPIVGAGYGLGINDFDLLKRSLRNLLIAVVLSLITSTLYFLVSPIAEAQSELLARTSPTFYDVLIAAFGGAAGIVAASRKDKSNAIPGVAIATALMPPLCTAGFGLANLELTYTAGALYLFIINAVFICISTYVFVRYLKFEKVKHHQVYDQKKIDRWIMIGAAIVIIPSLILAWFLMAETRFKTRANKFIENEIRFPGSFVLEKKLYYYWGSQSVKVTTVGDTITESELKILQDKMSFYGLDPLGFKLTQLSIDEKISRKMAEGISGPAEKISVYQAKISELESVIKKESEKSALFESIAKELSIIAPRTSSVILKDRIIYVVWNRKPPHAERLTVEKFLLQRTATQDFGVVHLSQFK